MNTTLVPTTYDSSIDEGDQFIYTTGTSGELTSVPYNFSTNSSAGIFGAWNAKFDIPNIALLTLVIVFGFGNVVSLVIFATTQEIRNVNFNYLAMAMAVADAVSSIFVGTLELIQVSVGHSSFGNVWCIAKLATRSGFFNISIFLVVAIAALRFRSACRRIHRPFTKRAMYITIALSVLFGFVGVGMRFDTSSYRHFLCVGKYRPIDAAAWLDLYGMAMCFLSLISYLFLFITLKCRNQVTVTINDSLRREIFTKRVCICMTALFLICFISPGIPHGVGFRVPWYQIANYDALLKTITISHSSLNPFIYLLFTPCMRKALARGLKRNRQVAPEGEGTSNMTTVTRVTTSSFIQVQEASEVNKISLAPRNFLTVEGGHSHPKSEEVQNVARASTSHNDNINKV